MNKWGERRGKGGIKRKYLNAKKPKRPQPKRYKMSETLAPRGSSSSSRRRRIKAAGVPRRQIRSEVRIGMMLPADHEETMGDFAEKYVALDLHIFFSIGNAEARTF